MTMNETTAPPAIIITHLGEVCQPCLDTGRTECDHVDTWDDDDDYDPAADADICECELDWRCGRHAEQFTPLELLNDAWAQLDPDPDGDRKADR